jgi:cobalt-zinc-cadmium efflux system outer membrane protein
MKAKAALLSAFVISAVPFAMTSTSRSVTAAPAAAFASVSASAKPAPSASAMASTAASASASAPAPAASGASASTESALPEIPLPKPQGSGEIPAVVGLYDALRLFHEKGYDLLIADAAIASAEGDIKIAGAVVNPTFSAGFGPVIGYNPTTACNATTPPSEGCMPWSLALSATDNGAILDNLIGKRRLRIKVAQSAFAVIKAQRKDTERQLDIQVKNAWMTLVVAFENWRFAQQNLVLANDTLERNRARYPGKIDEGSFARIETAKLEAESQVDLAEQAIRAARVGLAYLVGVRDKVPAFGVPEGVLKYTVPGKLAGQDTESLVSMAKEHRADLAVARFNKERASQSIDLAKRSAFPDISLSLSYSMTGYGQAALSPPTILVGVSVTPPLFYGLEGEIKKAQADLATQKITENKTLATIRSDVETAWESYAASKKLVERMETGGLLERSKRARDVTERQYREGKANLTDFLDAQRTYVSTMQEYITDLGNYWSAIYSMEQAIGMELSK